MGVWQHSSGGLAYEDPEERCGIVRASMMSNPVLSKSSLGKVNLVWTDSAMHPSGQSAASDALNSCAQVRKTTFNNLPPDHVFGLTPAHDTESCKAVMGSWKEHTPHGKATPGPDFLAMNKKASMR